MSHIILVISYDSYHMTLILLIRVTVQFILYQSTVLYRDKNCNYIG